MKSGSVSGGLAVNEKHFPGETNNLGLLDYLLSLS